jgi:CRP-like cAMP-binding protein
LNAPAPIQTASIFTNDPHVRTLAIGEVLFERGAEGATMFVVTEGVIELAIGDTVVEVVDAGGIFGEMALIEHKPRTATATAVTPAKIVEIDQKRFLYLVQNTPYFAVDVMKVMAGRIRHMDELQTH